jgi:signal transduction histidine kinase
MTALSVLAFLGIGVLNARGILVMSRAGLDPASMTNWVRIGIAFSCLAALLTTAIDYVIRHVEHSSRAASEALGDLRLAYERLALLHERLDAAKEEERRFIAGELHDDLGQLLTVIKLRLQMGAPGADTLGLVDQAIDRVRKISRELRPAMLDDVGLIPALRDHVVSQSALAGVPIQLDMPEGEDSSPRLSPALEIACFRIVQESLTNALRHASAAQIRVRVARTAGAIGLTISDDGNGFDTASLAALSAGHLGIIAMQERVRARGGTFAITSAPGAGTRVQVDLPIVS